MKKYCSWKKTTAFLMAIALSTGALPVSAGGLFNTNSGIVANAASEKKAPSVGTFFKVGDTIAITGETWFVVDDDPNSGDAKAMIENDLTITGYEYSADDNQDVWKTGDVELYLLHKGFYITRKDTAAAPEGFYITSGNGTKDAPFVLGVIAPKFSGRNITLNDGIVDDNNINNVKVKLSGDCAEANTPLSLDIKTIGGKDVYCVTANVNASKMNSVITADLYYGNNETPIDTLAFSVNDYLDAVDTTENTKLEALVKATRQYGKAAASYFGNGALPEVKDHSDEILNSTVSFGDYTFNKYQPRFDSSEATLSLVLNSKLAVRLYPAKYEESGHSVAAYDMWTFDENNKLVISPYTVINAFKSSYGKVCFEVPGITPTQIGTTFNVNYQGTDYLFSPMTWVYRVMSKKGAPAKDVAMANALYEYYIAATDYVGYGKE